MSAIGKLVTKLYQDCVPDSIKQYTIHHLRFIETQILRVKQGMNMPLGIDIETNTSCTRWCWYCPRNPNLNLILDDEVFYSIIDQLKNWHYNGRISLSSYNEPLTDKRIFDFIKYAKKQLPKSRIILPSNGDLLDASVIDGLIECGISELRVSLREPTSEKIINLKNEYQIISTIDLRDGFRRFPLSNRGGSIDVGQVISMPRCYYIEYMVIRADGNVILCCNDYYESKVFGNVKCQGVKEIWEKPEFVSQRKNIRNGKYELKICRLCGHQVRWSDGAINLEAV